MLGWPGQQWPFSEVFVGGTPWALDLFGKLAKSKMDWAPSGSPEVQQDDGQSLYCCLFLGSWCSFRAWKNVKRWTEGLKNMGGILRKCREKTRTEKDLGTHSRLNAPPPPPLEMLWACWASGEHVWCEGLIRWNTFRTNFITLSDHHATPSTYLHKDPWAAWRA